MEPSVVTTFPTAKFGAGDDSQRPPAQEESQLRQLHFSLLSTQTLFFVYYKKHSYHITLLCFS